MAFSKRILPLVAIVLFCDPIWAVPDWAKESKNIQKGQKLEIICQGTGPHLQAARSEALNSCRVSASQYLASHFEIDSLSVETEKTAAFHQKVSESLMVKNLSCRVMREEIEEKDGFFQVWNQCEFDLSKALVENSKKAESSTKGESNAELAKLSHKNINSRATSAINPDQRKLLIASVPACETLIVEGLKSRSIECTGNPTELIVFSSDERIIVRSKNYRPKTIHVNQVAESEEIVQVLLDLN